MSLMPCLEAAVAEVQGNICANMRLDFRQVAGQGKTRENPKSSRTRVAQQVLELRW